MTSARYSPLSSRTEANVDADTKAVMEDVVEPTKAATDTCALFLDSLPHDFEQSAQLQALGSILDEPEKSVDAIASAAASSAKPTANSKTASRKLDCLKDKRSSRKATPYAAGSSLRVQRKERHSAASAASAAAQPTAPATAEKSHDSVQSAPAPGIGETTLFLQLWKV